jgi:copper homeostasis protein
MPQNATLIEACVDSVDSGVAAESGGAERLELCDNLVEGGTTPSAGTMCLLRERVRIGVCVLVRARGADFVYSEDEMAVMLHDIGLARQYGMDGIVCGALTTDGTVDTERTKRLVDATRPLPFTFHRAFDMTRDPIAALDQLISLGVDRILTSGQASTALEGAEAIKRCVQHAAGRIQILAGGGIDEDNVAEIVARTGVKEVHVRGTLPVESRMKWRNHAAAMGKPYVPQEYLRMVTSPERIRAIRNRIQR